MRWKATLFSLWAQRARVSVPEPAEVMPTFLPSSSFAVFTGEAVFTPRIQPDHSSPLPPTILVSTPALAGGGDEGDRHRAEVGRAGRDGLEGLAAAAVDGDLRPESLLLEQPLLLGDRGQDGREVGLGRAADPDHFLRVHRTGGEGRDQQSGERRSQAVLPHPSGGSHATVPMSAGTEISRSSRSLDASVSL